jgi:hypothetical protein
MASHAMKGNTALRMKSFQRLANVPMPQLYFVSARTGLAQRHRIGVSDRLRTKFLKKIFASDRKVKVPPSARQVLPGSDLQLKVIYHRWNKSRDELSHFVSRQLNRIVGSAASDQT